MDTFYNTYKSLKSQWITQVNETSQGIIKNIVNKIIFQQHLDSFEESEFGELADFTGLQDKLVEKNKGEIIEMLEDLQKSVLVFENIINKMKQEIDSIIGFNPKLVSAPQGKLNNYLNPLLEAYQEEYKMRKGIVEDISSGFHMSSPYDVLVTITAAWSGRPYTNERALAEIEKFMDFEAGSIRISRVKK